MTNGEQLYLSLAWDIMRKKINVNCELCECVLCACPETAGKGAAQVLEGSKCQAEMKTYNWKWWYMKVAEHKYKKTFFV